LSWIKSFVGTKYFVAPDFNPGKKNKNKNRPRDDDDERDDDFSDACLPQAGN